MNNRGPSVRMQSAPATPPHERALRAVFLLLLAVVAFKFVQQTFFHPDDVAA